MTMFLCINDLHIAYSESNLCLECHVKSGLKCKDVIPTNVMDLDLQEGDHKI